MTTAEAETILREALNHYARNDTTLDGGYLARQALPALDVLKNAADDRRPSDMTPQQETLKRGLETVQMILAKEAEGHYEFTEQAHVAIHNVVRAALHDAEAGHDA